MADQPNHIEDNTAWEIHTREARHARLRSLADSINDTARTARNSLSLLLIVALYLGLTLMSSTDENLLRNGQVVLPQVGVGISVSQSYIFAPPIFLYLHIQLLFLLTVLARKVRTFEAALEEEFPDAASQNKQKEECWDWLSAFAFVQLFRLHSGVPHVAKVLSWFGVKAVPLTLLFVLDLSFVRYQSDWITWSHHSIFVLDLGFITWFNRKVSGREFPVLWTYIKIVAKRLRRQKTSAHEEPPCAERQLSERLGQAGPASWEAVAFTMALLMTLLLIFAAHPPISDSKTARKGWESIQDFWGPLASPSFDAKTARKGWEIEKDIWSLFVPPSFDPKTARKEWEGIRDSWGPSASLNFDPRTARKEQKSIWDLIREFCEAILEGKNPLDAGPCKWWGLACRYLNVSYKQLVKTQTWDISSPKPDTSSGKSFTVIDLVGRNLRFANFQYAQLQGANLEHAQLQGANLEHAQLQGADLEHAQLQGADLEFAQLQGADLEFAQLQGANLWFAQLQGADLDHAQLQGADLWLAELQGANLENAWLQGADLGYTSLQCADLIEAELQGANLGHARLQGASLIGMTQILLDAFDVLPERLLDSWFLAWAPNVSYDFPADKSSYLKTLITDEIATVKLAWRPERSLEEHLQECIEEDWKPRVTIPDSSKEPDWNTWAGWTVLFACEDKYTARSSLKRWESDGVALSGLGDKDFDQAQELVLKFSAFMRETKTEEECPGLHSIPDDEWKRFIGSQP